MNGSEEDSGWDRSFTSRGGGGGGGGDGEKSFGIPVAREEKILGWPGASSLTRRCGLAATGRGEISLRAWLDRPGRPVDMLESLHVFQQVAEAIGLAHSQGVLVANARPSCFVLSPSSNRVSFIESASCSSSGSDSFAENARVETGLHSSCSHSSLAVETHFSSVDDVLARRAVVETKSFSMQRILLMEFDWYMSPEEADGASRTTASDIYRLGVLLFELFCMSDTLDEKVRTMVNLRHRVLPPQMLLKWPKVASFCLWLLHPEPNSRPKMSEVLQSEFLNEARESLEEHDAAIKLKEEIEDQELLLEFLLQLQQRKQETANKLHDTVCFLSADMEEVVHRQSVLKVKGGSHLEMDRSDHFKVEQVDQPLLCSAISGDSVCSGSRKRFRPSVDNYEEDNENLTEGFQSETHAEVHESALSKGSRLMKNLNKLEEAYFSTRYRLVKSGGKFTNRKFTNFSTGQGSRTEGSSVDDFVLKEGYYTRATSEWIDPFLEGLCKYLSYSMLKVRADLKQGDLLNSSNLVCSLGFDRDREFFATAGVNRKIKIFECDVILNEERDIHYPVVEMGSRSKLSSICWNSYIKNQIASSDFDGVVQVWDVTRSQVFAEMREHEKRVWSVDFSAADPTKLASGSDDWTVKLWNINQGGSIGTIRTKANVCSVQFPPDSACSLAIGSADHNVYIYDLRNVRMPRCTLHGHSKTVSYVKFVDSSTLVSGSIDNSLKLWDLSMNATRVVDNPLQTFTGHINVKNFVGLSIFDGYIATGSESNEVFVYHKAFPMPVLSYKFSTYDSTTGREADDPSQFISCVCWRGLASTLVAANSSGNIKLLEMV